MKLLPSKLLGNLNYTEMLDIVASGEYWQKVNMVVADYHLPVDIQIALAQDEDFDVRWHLAVRHFLPAKVQVVMARDRDSAIRRNIANRIDLCDGAIEILSSDRDTEVKDILYGKYYSKE
jgi:hypothetical protein